MNLKDDDIVSAVALVVDAGEAEATSSTSARRRGGRRLQATSAASWIDAIDSWRRPSDEMSAPEQPARAARRHLRSLLWRDQRKEVVLTLADSSCGTLEVTGR